VSSVCTPRDGKYRVAVTKAMGHNLDAIVCDTAQTARMAVDHLKACRYPPQTFLPVNELHSTAVIDRVDRYHLSVFIGTFLVTLFLPALFD